MENIYKKLPAVVIEMLKDYHIEADDVVAVSQTDMNTSCEYADGFVIVTNTKLAVVTSPHREGEVRLFKGYVKRSDMEERLAGLDREWQIRTWDIADLGKLTVDPQVACALLVAEIDGVDTSLVAFSNLYKKPMHGVVRAYEKIHDPHDEGDGEIGPDAGQKDKRGGRGGHGKPEGSDDDDYCPICGMMYPDRNRKVCPRCMDRKSLFMRVLGFFKPYTARIVVMFICYLSIAGLNLIWPYLNGKVLYDGILAGDEGFLAKWGLQDHSFIFALVLVVLTMVATKLTTLLIQMLQSIFNVRIVTSVVCDIKKKIFGHMGKLSISFFKSRQTGGLMTRVLDDAEEVTGFFIDGAPYIFIHGITIIAMVSTMFSIKWQMALVAVILIPISIVVGYNLRPKMWNLFGHRHRVRRRVNSQVNDNLTGARVVKAFGQEHHETGRFDGNNGRLRDAEMSIVKFRNYYKIVFDSLYQLMNISIWVLGVWFMVGKGEMELGVLITFTGYVGQLEWPINFFTDVFHWWAGSMNSAQRIFEIMDSIPTIREIDNPRKLIDPEGHVVLKNVSFSYELNRTILKDISLDIPGGSMLGIVGRSGAGKTTLVNLISRMYDPQEGSILIDGVDVKELEFKDLRRNVAMVSQETYIFMGTVRENIAYADPDATLEDVIRAAKLASAHEFIMRMPDGYDTRIGASGRELSGGERQRISIARAILADPKILILDEATASVDTETERAIQTSLAYLIKGRTTISIAHRLSTLRDADTLVVLDNGQITERGTAQELMEQKGTYFKLMELQTKALALRD